MNTLIDEKIKAYKTELDASVDILLEITKIIKHKDLQKTVNDIKDRIDDPYMFVIVGEVKAGKSSFINALLDSQKEICKVAASPMTDTIQQIVYGEEESETELNTYLKRITQPVEILKEIAIVDTPGTNTIIDHHQEITENFIPSSDLIVFVFEAKNPYRQSSWDFFKYIKEEWRKKIIFILQQKDLMNEADLKTNVTGVTEYAKAQGIMSPQVFTVSALQEINGLKDESGFKRLREYIFKNITGGKAPFLKLINIADTTLNINDKIYKGVLVRKEQFEADKRFRSDIKETLQHQEEKTNRQVNILVENLVASYDRITSKKKVELSEEIGVFNVIKRSILSSFSKGSSLKSWLDEFATGLESALNTAFRDKLQEGVIDIADSIQNMGKIIDVKIKSSETILKDNHEIFAEIAERRTNVLSDLQKAFSNFLSRSENFYDENLTGGNKNLAPNLATGGGIAIVGIILTTLTNTMVFDITGGILTAIGFVFAGISVGLNKGKIISAYDKAVDEGRDKIEREVSLKLNNYARNIKEKIDDNFYKFDQLLEDEEKTISYLDLEYNRINKEIKTLKTHISKVSI